MFTHGSDPVNWLKVGSLFKLIRSEAAFSFAFPLFWVTNSFHISFLKCGYCRAFQWELSAHLFLKIWFALPKNLGTFLPLMPEDVEAAGCCFSPSPAPERCRGQSLSRLLLVTRHFRLWKHHSGVIAHPLSRSIIPASTRGSKPG